MKELKSNKDQGTVSGESIWHYLRKDKVISVLTVAEFDVNSSAEITMRESGKIFIVAVIPPICNSRGVLIRDTDSIRQFDFFEQLIEKAIGVSVIKHSKGIFEIPEPKVSTFKRLELFFKTYWDR